MENLTSNSQKTYEALKRKANQVKGARFPKLEKIAELLNELNVPYTTGSTQIRKYRETSGCNYYTGGGTVAYVGSEISVLNPNGSHYFTMETTATYYSKNTPVYAQRLCWLVEATL